MMHFIRNLAFAAVAAVATLTAANDAKAVTVIGDGDVVNISTSDQFIGLVIGNGGAGDWIVQFNSLVDPLGATALATIGPIQFGTFTDLLVQWIAVSDDFVLASAFLGVGETTLSTIFTENGQLGGNDISQYLVFSWSDSLKGAGFDVEVAAAVPLPAGGLLLIGGLGALALVRRRKMAA